MPKPSFVRPKIAAVEPGLIVYYIGKLSARDLDELDHRLRLAMSLTTPKLIDQLSQANLSEQPPGDIQLIAEKAITAGLVANDHL